MLMIAGAILPLLLRLLGGFGGSWALPRMLGSSALKRITPSILAPLLAKGTGFAAKHPTLTSLAGFFGGEAAVGTMLPEPMPFEDQGNEISYAELLAQLQESPVMDENKTQFLELLRRQSEAGALPDLLDEAGAGQEVLRLV